MTETAAYDSLNYNISNMSPKEPSIHGAALSLPDGALESIKGGPAYQLKWTNITKTVEVKDLSAGGLVGRSSLSLPAGSSESKVTGPATKTILHAVSGHAAPGQVLACMGASGAGKTSLMGVLSGRSSYQEGTLSINDKVLSKRDMKKLQTQIAYVKQKDVFFDHLTVRDQLTYTALLRLPKDLSTEDKHAEIEKIIHHLRLEKVADSPIMMVSGGERKRVNIGTELLTNPLIILLDEPTSKSLRTNHVLLVCLGE
jgi:ABC-type multidrug transport system ATPase subunit